MLKSYWRKSGLPLEQNPKKIINIIEKYYTKIQLATMLDFYGEIIFGMDGKKPFGEIIATKLPSILSLRGFFLFDDTTGIIGRLRERSWKNTIFHEFEVESFKKEILISKSYKKMKEKVNSFFEAEFLNPTDKIVVKGIDENLKKELKDLFAELGCKEIPIESAILINHLGKDYNLSSKLKTILFFKEPVDLVKLAGQHIIEIIEWAFLFANFQVRAVELQKARMTQLVAHELWGSIDSINNTAAELTNRIYKGESERDGFSLLINKIKKNTKYLEDGFIGLLEAWEKIVFERVEIKRIIEEEITYFEQISSNKIKFNLIQNDGNIEIKTSAFFLRLTLKFLIKNSVDELQTKIDEYSAKRKAGGRFQIKIRVEKINKKIHIYVSDTGRGVSKDIEPYLFKEKLTKKKNGFGKGLYLIKNIMEELNYNIEYLGRIKKETVFRIEL